MSVLIAVATLVARVVAGPRLVRQQVGPFAVLWLLTVAADIHRSTEFSDAESSWAYAGFWLWPVVAAGVASSDPVTVPLLHRASDSASCGWRRGHPDAIVRSIVAVHDGQVIFSPDVGGQVIAASTAEHAEETIFPALTPREREILDRLARGLRNDAIATRMGISLKTVQNNISSILLKLGASDRAQAVAIARDAGLGMRG